MRTTTSYLPVAIIGAGPIGLAAAAHLTERGLSFVVLEAGAAVGATIREWGHVQLFSPWNYNIDDAAKRLLGNNGWDAPKADTFPTGAELVSRYLEPLARLPQLAARVKLNAKVTGVSRDGRDKMKSDLDRESSPFRVRFEMPTGEEELFARAVIDASGTWGSPSPLGAEGIPARGERALNSYIRYGIPDVLKTERTRYANRRVLVAGSGHSAFNVLLDLVRLAEQEPATAITWIVRRSSLEQLFGVGERDHLAARGALGLAVRRLLDSKQLKLMLSFRAEHVEHRADGLHVHARNQEAGPVDEIIVATGFRPDFSYLRELQLGLDPVVEATPALAPLIDPNLHSCGTVRPHGHATLAHPEHGFYIAGVKSYGRAPTFLLRTGYEQVRSIVAALAHDHAAANRVELVLPETGACSLEAGADDVGSCCGIAKPKPADERLVTSTTKRRPDPSSDTRPRPLATETSDAIRSNGCCGGAPQMDTAACCRKDEEAKRNGETGCGCRETSASNREQVSSGACCG